MRLSRKAGLGLTPDEKRKQLDGSPGVLGGRMNHGQRRRKSRSLRFASWPSADISRGLRRGFFSRFLRSLRLAVGTIAADLSAGEDLETEGRFHLFAKLLEGSPKNSPLFRNAYRRARAPA
jgi:hypothetical protein